MKGYLLNNKIDDEFQRMLFPLNFLQSIWLQSKFRIFQRSVRPNNFLAHLKNFLGGILIMSIYLTNCFYVYPRNSASTWLLCLDILVVSLITFTANFTQSQNNVLLVLKMQQAYRLFDSNISLKRYKKHNWIAVTVLIITWMTFLGFYLIKDCTDYSGIISVLAVGYFDGNFLYASQIIKFLEHELRLWLVELERYFATCAEPDHNELMKYFNEIEQQKKRLYSAFVDIMDAFQLFVCIFQYSILQLSIECFVHPIIFIYIYLTNSESVYRFDSGIQIKLLLPLYLVKYYALLIYLCASCQQFYLVAAEVDETCAVIQSQDDRLYMLDIQKLCKNVRRVSACARADGWLRAGGVVAVDAALPLRLLALLATYTVVLLQFALL